MKLSSTLIAASCLLLSASTNAVEIKSQSQAKSTSTLTSTSTSTSALASKNNAQFVQYLKAKKIENGLIASLTEIRGDFDQWRSKFEKVYHSVEEEVERMLIWFENHEFIHAHNNQSPAPSYTVGHNQFSDMTNDEFQKLHSLGRYSPGVDVIRAGKLKRMEEGAKKRVVGGEKEGEHPMVAEYRYLRSLAVGSQNDAKEEGGEENGGGVGGLDDWFNFDDKMFNDDGTSSTDDATETDDGTSPTDDDDTNGLPDAVDWVASGAVTPVKNQQSCGSCWAFSSTGAIEGASFIKYGQLVSLSEQNLLDCDTVDNGCSGGLMENAFKYDESAKGLCSEADYPYLATDGHECSAVSCQKVNGTAVSDYIDIDEKDKHGLIASIVLQPTSIAMQADQLSFQFYNGGVFNDKECGASGAVDHGVLAVGYGTDAETGMKYFTVKNSWGDSWGENGYVRLSRESTNDWGTCAILMIMTAPIIA